MKTLKGRIILAKKEKAGSYNKKKGPTILKKKWKGRICIGGPNIYKIYIIYLRTRLRYCSLIFSLKILSCDFFLSWVKVYFLD